EGQIAGNGRRGGWSQAEGFGARRKTRGCDGIGVRLRERRCSSGWKDRVESVGAWGPRNGRCAWRHERRAGEGLGVERGEKSGGRARCDKRGAQGVANKIVNQR